MKNKTDATAPPPHHDVSRFGLGSSPAVDAGAVGALYIGRTLSVLRYGCGMNGYSVYVVVGALVIDNSACRPDKGWITIKGRTDLGNKNTDGE